LDAVFRAEFWGGGITKHKKSNEGEGGIVIEREKVGWEWIQ
jgi:hypothetical protein